MSDDIKHALEYLAEYRGDDIEGIRKLITDQQARIAELKEKLKTAEQWDVIESQRNEELQARIDELENKDMDLST